jgi:Core-2/I-Branching enzyme
MIHNNFRQFQWLIDAICNDEDYFLIHIDKRSDHAFCRQVKEYVGSRPNVKYLAPRRMLRFGWSIVETELRAIRELASAEHEWNYLINVSGQDYPIKSTASIKAALTAAWPRNFVDVIPFEKIAVFDPYDPHLSRRLAFEMFGSVIETPIRLPFSKNVDIKYKGSAWVMLARDFCEYVLSSPVTRTVKKLMRYTWNPDELFFQALIMNSGYRNSLVEHYGREIVWASRTASPKTLGMEDYDLLSASSALFARKFDEAVDREILVSLAHDHGYQVPAR